MDFRSSHQPANSISMIQEMKAPSIKLSRQFFHAHHLISVPQFFLSLPFCFFFFSLVWFWREMLHLVSEKSFSRLFPFSVARKEFLAVQSSHDWHARIQFLSNPPCLAQLSNDTTSSSNECPNQRLLSAEEFLPSKNWLQLIRFDDQAIEPNTREFFQLRQSITATASFAIRVARHWSKLFCLI